MIKNEYTKTGTFNLQRGEDCQDRMLFYDDKKYSLAVISDGATSCGRASEGAETTCQAVKDFFVIEGDRTFQYSAEKLSYLLTEHILYWLERKAEEERVCLGEYASTVVACFVDNKTGETLALGLGDSACCRIRDKDIEKIIIPRRFHGHPCLVTTKGAYKAMTVKVSEIGFNDVILLCTDGFVDAINRDDRRIGGVDYLLRQGDYKNLNNRLEKVEIRDDCSYMTLSRTR